MSYFISGCTGCGACRLVAPEYFGESDGLSYVIEQPPQDLVDIISCEHIISDKQ